ncbi:hypothetical protein [Nocardia pseudobrasiliensis]|uniref:Uncharacterized protein n=1 Tax=Nocardia pseudobrasiliensis TaxID=45979 RepID=A0A370HPQ5_9NOCA|nr:hypothetical protein [Nocardia pseudobrasiliensis]RDI60556.1 hypothetical protein DFR76_115186 [Nocardia pseudobrasiliensis]
MKTPGPQHISRGADAADARDRAIRLSPALTAIAVVSLTAGIVSGGVAYLGRSPHREEHVAGTAAWWPHLALLALAVVVALILRRRTRSPRTLVFAPLGSRAAQRLRRTLSAAWRRPTVALRLLAGLVPMLLLAYIPWRIGVQILGGLDPNFTANAWGGPSYVGAMACHYLDAALLVGAAAGVLNALLLPAEKSSR